MVETTLGLALEQAILSMWPRRSHRELLLDLGERKDWTEHQFCAQVAEVAAWLQREVGLAERLRVVREPDGAAALDRIKRFARSVASGPEVPGVAAWATSLGPATGLAAKTLANSARGGLQAARADHRWLALIDRAARGAGAEAAWLYHRRSAVAVDAELGAMAGRLLPDAGDAMLVISLLSLWQRRRPTEQARANRGQSRSRRATPKPVAGVRGALISVGQVEALAAVAAQLEGTAAARSLLVVALESALTEAHLAPHPARGGEVVGAHGGDPLLRAVEAALGLVGGVFGEEAEVFRFRIDRMRAWRARRPQAAPSGALSAVPYVAASMALEAGRGDEVAGPLWETGTPGLLMLLPLLRRREMLR